VYVYTSPIVITNIEPIQEYATKQSIKYNVDPILLNKVITCESNWKNVQSRLYNKKDGGRELSFGIVQIHLPDHKDITKSQALDERFSIRYIVSEIAQGRGKQWTCYRRISGIMR